MHLRENIKVLRARKDMTQEDLAFATGIKLKSIGAYEEGRATPKIDTIERLSDYFGVTIDDMVKKELKILSL